MTNYSIYPIKGEAAKSYLSSLGCSVGTELLTIPDHLLVKHDAGTTYAVTRRSETVFCIQHYPSNRWRVVVPVSYRMAFSQLLQAYRIDESLAKRLIGNSGAVDLIQGLPVQRSLAEVTLKWLSDYTGHPYDLENVPVVLAD